MFAFKRAVKPEAELDYDRIIRCFGAVLEATGQETISNERILPVEKEILKPIILAAIFSAESEEVKANLTNCYFGLAKFQTLSDLELDAVEEIDAEIIFNKVTPDPVRLIKLLTTSNGQCYHDLLEKVTQEMSAMRKQVDGLTHASR